MAVGWNQAQIDWLRENDPDKLAAGYEASGGNQGYEGGYTGTGDEWQNWTQGELGPGGVTPGENPLYDRNQGRKGLGYGDASVYDQRLDWYFPEGMEGNDSKAKWMADALDQQSAELMREQWESDKDMYFPVLKELQSRLTDEYREGVVDRAGNRGLAAGLQAQQMAKRDISRYGVEMSGAQQRQFDTGMQHNLRLNELSSRNLARQQMHDAQVGLKQTFAFDLARGVQSGGLQGVVGQNALGIDRANAAYSAYQTQNQAQQSAKYSMAGSIIGGLAMGATMV